MMLSGVADSRELSSLSELSHPTQYNVLQDNRDTYYKTK